jgi:uncharacterized surface protein with fasciclin (FAS1) repeats
MYRKKLLSVLSALLLAVFALSALAPAAVAAPAQPNLVETAIAVNGSGPYAGQFDTLIAALLAADPAVLQILSGKGQFTVFAPTDGAFEALGLTPETVGELPQGFLTQVLAYHVARGRRDAGEVLASDRIRMLKGGFLLQSNGVLTDNLGRTANIIVTDVAASNGIIHVIDAVVLPQAP